MTAVNQDVGVDAPFVQGDTLTLQVPVFEADGTTPTDLSAASAIRWEVQRLIGGVPVVVDPPLITKELGSGIEILAAAVGEDFPSRFQVVLDLPTARTSPAPTTMRPR